MASSGKARRSVWRRRGVVSGGTVAVAAMLAALIPATSVGAAGPRVTESARVPSSLPLGGVCESEFDSQGKLWVEQYLSSQVAKYDTQAETFEQHDTPMPLSVPGGMEMGPDGRMWMPEVTGNALFGIDTKTGKHKEVQLPWANALNVKKPPLHLGIALSNDIAQGPDGKMYFTLGGLNAIGSYDTQTGEFEKYPVPEEILGQIQALLGIIKKGPGRTLVMDLPQMNRVVTLNVDTKQMKQYTMPTPASLPVGVRGGSDGNIWVTEALGMKIARINPNTGAIKELPLFSVDRVAGNLLGGLKEGSVGNPMPFLGPITEGPDGKMYFAVSLPLALGLGNQIGRLDMNTGEIETWRTPSSISSPCDLNISPDGEYAYFGNLASNTVGRLRLND